MGKKVKTQEVVMVKQNAEQAIIDARRVLIDKLEKRISCIIDQIDEKQRHLEELVDEKEALLRKNC